MESSSLDPRQPVDTLRTIPRKFERKAMKTDPVVSTRSKQMTQPFQWLLFSPQKHAIAPFDTQTQTRLDHVNNS